MVSPVLHDSRDRGGPRRPYEGPMEAQGQSLEDTLLRSLRLTECTTCWMIPLELEVASRFPAKELKEASVFGLW